MQMKTELNIGVEEESDIPVEADAYAFVDDGTHSVVWAVTRNDDYEVTVTMWLCHGELVERDGVYGTKHFGVDPEESTEAWAEDYAHGHQDSIQHARGYYE